MQVFNIGMQSASFTTEAARERTSEIHEAATNRLLALIKEASQI